MHLYTTSSLVLTGIWHIDALFDGFGIVWGKTTERSCHLVLLIRL